MEEVAEIKSEEEFVPVKSRKRKSAASQDVEMETTTTVTGTNSIEDESSVQPAAKKPFYPPLSASTLQTDSQKRKVLIPNHRYTPLKENWLKIYTPIVEQLKLQIRFNIKTRTVELRTCKSTEDIGALQKGADFVKAFALGFDVDDALALLRLDDLYLESFDVTDVKPLKGDHLGRAVGRLAGKNGKTKFTIENVTKTRIVLADTKVHLLGSFQNIKIARNSICNLILGSPPSKVYGKLRTVASRSAESF